jgi:hypothetical protein
MKSKDRSVHTVLGKSSGWRRPWLEVADWLQLLHLVVVADVARPDKILFRRAHRWHEEVHLEAMWHFLNSHIAGPLHTSDDLLCER